MNNAPTIIKGNWSDKGDEIKAAQSGPFIFIESNGSKWGEPPDDVAQLLEALAEYPLDPTFEKYGNFITIDPCVGVLNPDYMKVDGAAEWIDGPRLFDVDGVTSFFGNFFTLSHVFRICTNDAETAEKLTAAIRANQQRDDYLAAKVRRAA